MSVFLVSSQYLRSTILANCHFDRKVQETRPQSNQSEYGTVDFVLLLLVTRLAQGEFQLLSKACRQWRQARYQTCPGL
jgi:hypothetical protein